MTTTKKASTSTASKDAQKIKDLEKRLSDLTAMMQLLTNQNNNLQQTNDTDRDVVFISLCSNILNLSTEPNGGGTIYTFYSFGEEQVIPYSDARRIIRSNKSFIKGGKCYIADDGIIKAERLTNDYKNILNKDSLLELFSADRNTFKNIFDTMTDMQKELFRDIVVERLVKDRNSVDMNIVQYINETLNTDLLQSIEYGKEIFKVEN